MEMQAEMQNLVGQTMGNWRLKGMLGEGAFGAVFEADHVAISGKRGAVKILKPEMSTNASMKQRFLNEASAASRAEHENIVQIFDGGIAPDGTCYQVMEMLSGKVLTKLIQTEKRLDPGRAVNITAQIASALQAAHNLQIVHRDLKPDNVFIVERANNPEFVKVLDFGIAKLRGDQGMETNDKLTSTGMIIGTAPYMAPEQWQSRPDIDGRADIYSLGVMLFEMLCGQRPYAANNAYEWIVLHMEATPPELTNFGVTPQLSRVVRRMLAREPQLRQQSMRDVIQDLRTASRGVRNIAAFSTDGMGASAPTAIKSSDDIVPATPAYVPPPQHQSQAGYPQHQSQAGYPQHPSQAGYPQHPSQAGYPQNYPQQNYPQNYPQTAMVPPQAAAPPRMWLRRLGEIGLMVLVVLGYFIYNWRETITTVRNVIQTLKTTF
jgi:serine/threonine protein kinase